MSKAKELHARIMAKAEKKARESFAYYLAEGLIEKTEDGKFRLTKKGMELSQAK